MKAVLGHYAWEEARDLKQALKLLHQDPKLRPFAGGTDLMVLFESGRLPAGTYLNLWNLDELKEIEIDEEFVSIGALCTYSQIRDNPVIQKEFPLLVEAASLTGAIAIQNRGTLGGNIANASPAADSPPALLVYETGLELRSTENLRWIDYSRFHTGYKQMDLHPGELITRVRIKRNTAGLKHYYRKVGTRKAQAISKICMAAVARVKNQQLEEIKIALASVAPIPLRCFKTEVAITGKKMNTALIDEAVSELEREITPISDIRSTESYRRRVSCNLLRDFLQGLSLP